MRGVTSVNTTAHARPYPRAHLITAEKPQAGSLYGYAPVAQGIEQRFPKPRVAGSNPAGGATRMRLDAVAAEISATPYPQVA